MTAAPWLSTGRLAVLGTGFALPGDPVTSEALIGAMTAHFGLTKSRGAHALAQRLRIETRHFARPFRAEAEDPRAGQSNTKLAAKAVRGALDQAGLCPSALGYLIAHTATPAHVLPGNVGFVADELDYHGPHIELRQACTGFANALMIAFGLLQQPGARPVAIVGSDTGSLIFDPRRAAVDPSQLVNFLQMGDGAAAIILAPARSGGAHIHSAWYGALGVGRAPGLMIGRGQPADIRHDYARIAQDGAVLFEADVAAADRHGLALHDADMIIPHQTSGRIGTQIASHFGICADTVFVNAHRVGNTGSAAIWLALAQLRVQPTPAPNRVLVLGAEATKFMYGGFAYQRDGSAQPPRDPVAPSSKP